MVKFLLTLLTLTHFLQGNYLSPDSIDSHIFLHMESIFWRKLLVFGVQYYSHIYIYIYIFFFKQFIYGQISLDSILTLTHFLQGTGNFKSYEFLISINIFKSKAENFVGF